MVQTIRSALLRAAAIAVVATGIAGYSESASACPTEAYMGTVCTVAFDFCPEGYLPAAGQEMQVSTNQALFSLLGVRYGGDGTTKFNLPDLRGRMMVGANPTGTGGLAVYQLGQKRGVESVTLSNNQAPLIPHSHNATFTGSSSGSATASGNVTLTVSDANANVTVSANPSLPVSANNVSLPVTVSGQIKLASSTAGAGAIIPPAGGTTLTRAPGASIYAPAGTGADVVVGPSHTLTGTATGNIAGTATGTITSSGTVNVTGQKATGTISLPVTGSTSGGTVTVAPAGQPATAATPVLNPSLALTTCIATYGIYPVRP